jgi:hypothetical protein
MSMGALWNSLTFVATAEGLLTRFKHSLPWLADQFTRAVGVGGLARGREELIGLYEGLPSVDFSEALLQRSSRRFHVLRVPGCGWTDLGTPGRIFECVRKWGCPIGPTCSHENGHCELPHAPLDLARAVTRRPGGITVTPRG